MHYNFLKIYFIVVLLAIFTFAKDKNIDISNIDKYYNCSEQIEVLLDKDEQYVIEDLPVDNFYIISNTAMGYVEGAVWTRLNLTNTKEKKEVLVVSPRVNINIIEVYIFKDGVFEKKLSLGNYNHIQNSMTQSKFSNFILDIEKNSKYTIISKLKSKSPIDTNWVLTIERTFLSYIIMDMFFWGILGGLVLSLIIYNLSVFRTLKNYSYIAYIFHGLFALIFQFATNGVFYQLELYENLKIFNSVAWVSAQLNLVCSLFFVMLFFETKKTMTTIHKIIWSLIIFTTLMVILFSYSLINAEIIISVRAIAKPIALLSAVFLVIVGFIALRKNITGSLYYLLGHGIFMLSLLYQQFNSSILNYETNFVSIYIAAFGMLFDIVFLSIALSRKVADLKYEKEKNEKLLISQSSFSAIGRTIGNLSHQWKIPVVRIGSLLTQIEALLWTSNDKIKEQLPDIVLKMRKSLEFIDDCIKEFNDFYSNVSKEITYSPSKEVLHILDLLSAKTAYTNTMIITNLDDTIETFGHKNAFANVCLVIIDNALDTFKQRKIQHGRIVIDLTKQDNLIHLIIKDNGGGIKITPIKRIFDVFVSDKEEGNGMGLAMVEVLVKERLHGNIFVHNGEDGAIFEVVLNLQ